MKLVIEATPGTAILAAAVAANDSNLAALNERPGSRILVASQGRVFSFLRLLHGGVKVKFERVQEPYNPNILKR